MGQTDILAKYACESVDELLDVLENEVFQIKQELLQKPILLLTVKSRINRLNELQEAADFLELSIEHIDLPIFEFSAKQVNLEIVQAFLVFQASWKLALTQAAIPSAIVELILIRLTSDLNFASPFSVVEWEGESPTIGKEPDPMLYQSFIRYAARNNWFELSDWIQNQKQLESEHLLLLKRLSLLPKYLKE